VPFDLVIDIEKRHGALAEVDKGISDAGVNIAAATCIGPGDRAGSHPRPHAGRPGTRLGSRTLP
jgi:hypothetical protein